MIEREVIVQPGDIKLKGITMLPEPLYTPPSKQEMQARLERVRSMMEDQEITHYVVTCPDSVVYLTNFANYVHERPFIIVVSLEGPLLFVVPKLEIPHVEIRSIGDIELVEYFEFLSLIHISEPTRPY